VEVALGCERAEVEDGGRRLWQALERHHDVDTFVFQGVKRRQALTEWMPGESGV
jgi:hypothetical protein